jgi:hypothetical protein
MRNVLVHSIKRALPGCFYHTVKRTAQKIIQTGVVGIPFCFAPIRASGGIDEIGEGIRVHHIFPFSKICATKSQYHQFDLLKRS